MKNKGWIIRRANLNDVDELQTCAEKNSFHTGCVNLRDEIKKNPVWIVELNNHAIGCMALHLNKNTIRIAYVMISAEYKDQGLARFLVEFAESEAAKRECSSVMISQNHNHDARFLSLYRHLGWTEKKHNKPDVTVMIKNIESIETALG